MPSQAKRKKRQVDQRRKHTKKTTKGNNGTVSNVPTVFKVGLEECMRRIHEVELKDMPAMIAKGAEKEYIEKQEDLISLCLERILYFLDSRIIRKPKSVQTRILRRLIYGKNDTLCIAKTGFGKSLILHAYSILTGQITLQIILLAKLGEERFEDIKKLPSTSPCFLNSESLKEQATLIDKISNLEYTYILLSPEQMSSSKFRDALKSSDLQSNIGLVVIDECHLIAQWKDFRSKFSMLEQLRYLLPQDCVWFGCTAILNADTQKIVLQDGGFRRLGNRPYQTSIVRTSVDRPNISLAMVPIPSNKITSYESLFYLLDQAVDDNGNPTPKKIPKIIVFVNMRNLTGDVATYLRGNLLEKIKDKDERYSIENNPKRLCVTDIIGIFHSKIGMKDRAAKYKEFVVLISITYIMVAITSLTIGINIPNVDAIVVWDVRQQEVPEIWQRIGRGGRGLGCISKAYIFIPYFCFDSYGSNPPTVEASTSTSSKASTYSKDPPARQRSST